MLSLNIDRFLSIYRNQVIYPKDIPPGGKNFKN